MSDRKDQACKWCHHDKAAHKGSKVFGTGAKCTEKYCPCVFYVKEDS